MVDKVLFSHKVTEWQTPKELYDRLNKVFNFDLDPCTTNENPLETPTFFTKEMNGLFANWNINRVVNVFVNPPYNDISNWINKGIAELNRPEGTIRNVVFLLPARTDTQWFHNYIYTNIQAKIHFLKGRLKFRGAKNSAPFPSMVVIFSKKE